MYSMTACTNVVEHLALFVFQHYVVFHDKGDNDDKDDNDNDDNSYNTIAIFPNHKTWTPNKVK